MIFVNLLYNIKNKKGDEHGSDIIKTYSYVHNNTLLPITSVESITPLIE